MYSASPTVPLLALFSFLLDFFVQVGVSDKCVMGLNQNHGMKILLRLRTDDLQGFRKVRSPPQMPIVERRATFLSSTAVGIYIISRRYVYSCINSVGILTSNVAWFQFCRTSIFGDAFFCATAAHLAHK